MERKILEKLISDNQSIRQMSNSLNLSYSSVKYWLNKYNLKTNYKKQNLPDGKKKCSECKNIFDVSMFYKKKDKYQPYCKTCFNQICTQRWIDRKIWAIQYKGSNCVDCNLSYPSTPYPVFEFHHLDPSEKDLDWSKIRLTSKDKMKSELDKCVLLCANCHRIRHFKEH